MMHIGIVMQQTPSWRFVWLLVVAKDSEMLLLKYSSLLNWSLNTIKLSLITTTPDFVVVECNRVDSCNMNIEIRFRNTLIGFIDKLWVIVFYNFKRCILISQRIIWMETPQSCYMKVNICLILQFPKLQIAWVDPQWTSYCPICTVLWHAQLC